MNLALDVVIRDPQIVYVLCASVGLALGYVCGFIWYRTK